MNDLVVPLALVVGVIGLLLILRYARNNRKLDATITALCRGWRVPDRPFDVAAAVRQVMAGTRSGVPRDGQWWVASGIEHVGNRSRTRLVHEGVAADRDGVRAAIDELFSEFGGHAVLPPHLPEGRFIGRYQAFQ